LIDDDKRLRSALGRYLQHNGYRVTEATDAADAHGKLRAFEVDLILLDAMVPGESGFTLLSELRKTSRAPVLVLTATGEAEDRLKGLEHGADDYLAKPFDPRELQRRLKNLLPHIAAPARELVFGPYRLDLDRGRLTRHGQPVHLTEGMAALLTALAAKPGEPMSYDHFRDVLPALGRRQRLRR